MCNNGLWLLLAQGVHNRLTRHRAEGGDLLGIEPHAKR